MLKSKFKKFSRQTLSANLSGKEIAEKMLSDHGIYDVKVISVLKVNFQIIIILKRRLLI